MDITQLRAEIDRLDDELLQLFIRRMVISGEIADYKKAQNMPIFVPSREREKLATVGEKAGADFSSHAKVLYSLLFELSRSHQSQRNESQTALFARITAAIQNTAPLFPTQSVIACYGQESLAVQTACEKLFKEPNTLYFNSLDAVFSAVEQGLCRYGVVPLDSGSECNIYDQLTEKQFSIVRAFRLNSAINGVERFICISKELEIYPGADKTTLMLVLPNKPGSLYRVLARFYVLGINVSRLQSQAIAEREFDIMFYFDLDTSIYSQEFVHLMCELEDLCQEFQYLGSYTEVLP